MMRKEGNLAGCIQVIAFVILLFFSISYAQAASLYFSPSSTTRSFGQTFSAVVRVNTDGQAINAAQGSIVYDPAHVEVTSISKAGSIFNLWTQDPVFSNSEGTINFEGGLPSPGYSGSSGLILTVSFRTKNAGDSNISLVSGAILANDGQGTNILTNLGKLTLLVTGGSDQSTPPSATPDTTTTTASTDTPKVESSTHPDSTKWYSGNDPQFSWNLPAGVTGVSFLITDKATSNPGPKSDGLQSKASFSDVADGTQYLHIKFKQNGVWGPIAHFQFNVDTKAPETFAVTTVSSEDPNPQIKFETTDALSGIDHYEVQIGDGAWSSVPSDQASKAYKLQFDKVGTYTVSVKAFDKAGNSIVETLPITVAGIVGSIGNTWIEKGFNKFVNGISSYGLLVLFLALFVGFLVFLFQLLGTAFDRAWHHLTDKKSIRKNERLADKTFDHLIKDMQDEVKFLNAIGKRRKLGPEEKYLKGKLAEYARALKKGR